MFKQFYTTAMCPQGKVIEKRFRQIRKGGSVKGYASLLGIFLALTILTTSVLASGVLQSAVYNDNRIEVRYNGEVLVLKHTPFIDNEEIYLPLREVIEHFGNVSYDNGNIMLTLPTAYGDGAQSVVLLRTGEPGVYIDAAKDSRLFHNGYLSTSHPALLVGDTTYVPLGMLIRIKSFRLYEGDSQYNDVAFEPHWLEGLEVRKYSADGKFDKMLTSTIDTTGENRYAPENYYEENENVVIGTAEELNAYGFHHKEVNGYYYPEKPVKTIWVDENRKVLHVVPCENQKHEMLEPSWGGGSSWRITLGLEEYVGNEPRNKRPQVVYDQVHGPTGSRLVGCYYLSPELWVY